MRHQFHLRAAAIIAVFICATLPTAVLAKVVTSESSVSVGADEIVQDDLFISGETVAIDGTVNGDVYAAAGSVTVNGTVNGDVYMAGGMLTLNGTVRQDVLAAGGNVFINGATIGDSLILVGGNVIVDDATTVGGGMIYATGTMNLAAYIGRGLMGASGDLAFSGSVAKDMNVTAETIAIGANAAVDGNLSYLSEQPLAIENEAVVAGSIQRIAPDVKPDQPSHEGEIGWRIWMFLAALLVGCLAIRFFPRASSQAAERVIRQPLHAYIFGIAAFIGLPIAIAILCFTIIGIPLALLTLAAYLVSLYLVQIVLGLVIGRLFYHHLQGKEWNRYASFGIGLLALYIVTALPYLGPLLSFLGIPFAFGAIVLMIEDALKKKPAPPVPAQRPPAKKRPTVRLAKTKK